jgi:hypothetical protein
MKNDFNKGVLFTIKELNPLIEDLRWFCLKHNECGDMISLCIRKTPEECCFRKENPLYHKFKESWKKFEEDNG